MSNTYTKAIASNMDIDNEPEFICTDGIEEIRRKRARSRRIHKQQKTACAVCSVIVFIAFFAIFIGCLAILVKIHPESFYTFLIWVMIIATVMLFIGAAVAGYLHECILRSWRK